jgi:DNA replication protein DnaC
VRFQIRFGLCLVPCQAIDWQASIRSLVCSSVLLLDKLGFPPIGKRGAVLLFLEVVAHYKIGSIVISTSRPVLEWGILFDVDNTIAMASIDRLMLYREAVVSRSSYRMRDKDLVRPQD